MNINAQDSGLFGFPEGLGWSILQMAIIMTLIFVIVVAISLLTFFIQKRKFCKKNNEICLNGIEADESKDDEIKLESQDVEECIN